MMNLKKMLWCGCAVLLAACSSGSDDLDNLTPGGGTGLSVPQNVRCTLTGETSLTFAWDAVSGAASYRYLATDATGKTVGSASVSEPSATVSGLKEGTEYRFRVQACNGSDVSDYSAFISAKTTSSGQGDLIPLAVPSPQRKAASQTSLTVGWSAVSHAAAYAYELTAGEGGAVESGETDALELTFDGLTPATTYQFVIKALAGESEYYGDSEFSEPLVLRTSSEGVDPSLVSFPANEQDGVIRAFPGAEGGGMYTTGGRGGKIYHVTTLADGNTPGTFRYAVSQSGARIVVFDVAGTITLESDLPIQRGDLTIAGQTAPGDGICIKGGTVNIKANNIIIRFVRFRLGDESPFLNDGSDCIWGRYNENIILDHCPMSWSVDEVASFYANRNFTMQWCVVAESMCNAGHDKGSHGYGGIWGGKNASFHHNLLAHNKSRNARIDHPEIYLQNGGATDYRPTHRGHVDYRNNVIYNWGDNSTYGGEDGWFNIVGNYYKPGPASKDRKYFVDANGFYNSSKTQYNYARMYVAGNVHTECPAFTDNQQSGIFLHDGSATGNAGTMFMDKLLPIKYNDEKTCYVSSHTAEEAFEQVMAYVGASLHRDAVDDHIVKDALSRSATYPTGSRGSTGGIIDSQKDVGGWPVLKATDEELAIASADMDGDGIPDYYEELFGLNPADPTDANEKTLDPQGIYPNIEVYFHYLVQDIVAEQVLAADYMRLE